MARHSNSGVGARADVDQTQKPHWYDWLYDDSYLDDVVHAVEGYVRTRGLHVYEPTVQGYAQSLPTAHVSHSTAAYPTMIGQPLFFTI